MILRFFSNYCDSTELLDRCLSNYNDESETLFEFTCGNNYDVAVVFNTTQHDIKAHCLIITIIQEPSWFFGVLKNPFLHCSDYVFLHDISLFPYAKNVIEFPSLMFYHDREPMTFFKTKNHLKSKKLSFITSNKNMCEGHHKRLKFLDEILQSDLDIDIYGYGLNTHDKRYKGSIPKKHQGLIPYEFSICIENSVEKNYITEKFIDCSLCDTIPLYYGAPNSAEIYDQRGYETIDIENPAVIHHIKEIIKEGYSKYGSFNNENKRKYFSEYNLLTVLSELLYDRDHSPTTD